MTNAPAGWYPDPEYPGQQRYWDGSSWTVNRAPTLTPATPNSAPADHTPSRRSGDSTQAVLGLVLAILGFVLGVIPFAAWFAWLLFVPALILAIRVLVQRRPGRGQSTSAIIVVGVGWMISLVMGLGSFGALADNPESQANVPTVASSTPSASATPASPTPPSTSTPTVPASPQTPGIGQAVTNRAGVSFTVTGAQCGLGAQDNVFGDVAPKGQFCKVDFVVANGSTGPQVLTTTDVYGYIGNGRYQAETNLGTFGDDFYSTTVNPGLSVNCTVFFDVPSGASLDRVKLMTGWWGGDGATVTLR
ncbi:DUF2510 domain-containing protein [Leifsonia sp. 2MCAF36]|uniref:DUF2510 domain-containing protein n=1 Tax=Leifsonia sp. 2MCAF36 TaxID=3232988 RepID=UPI003F9B3EDD